ncbi:MAG TPA: chromate resistance protein ChrB domain-containing protein [Vicinamibacterales bacterium]
MPAQPRHHASLDSAPTPKARQWLILIHQLPPVPSNLRVRTWRRLQQLGAIPFKQAVYALPDSADRREDLEWLKAEILAAGGEAAILSATHLDSVANDELVEAFKKAREDDYAALARDLEDVLKRADGRRRQRGQRAPALRRLSALFRQRLAAIESIDFFASAGRDRVISLIERLAEGGGAVPISRRADPAGGERYEHKLWVTRPRPGVDRMASAWLIRRFIDPNARFSFAADQAGVPADALAFDMFGVDFTHRGDDCTFETFCQVFKLNEPAMTRVAELVHDLDLKDSKFGAPEAATVGAMIEGLQLTHADDHALLEQGIAMFESLYRSFEKSARPPRPRSLAKPAKKAKRR